VPKKYVLKLTEDERAELQRLVRKGRVAGWKLKRAHALLQCDQAPGGPAWTDQRIAEAYDLTTRSLESWRRTRPPPTAPWRCCSAGPATAPRCCPSSTASSRPA